MTPELEPHEPEPHELEKATPSPLAALARPKPPAGAFEVWWDVYPRKVGKRAAAKAYAAAWTRALGEFRDRPPHDRLLAAAGRFAADPNRDEEFTPYPATWLNRDGWDDEPCTRRGTALAARSTGPAVHGTLERAMVRARSAEEAAR